MLTTLSIRALKPQSKPYKLSHGKGLFLLVQPSGAKLWRLRFRHRRIERKLALGRFPEMSLQKARAMRDEAQAQLADGIDPVIEKRRLKLEAALVAATTFRLVADEYIEKMERERKADATLKKARWLRDLFDKDIGHRPVAEITPHELLSVLKRVERRGHHETAQRLQEFAGRIFRYSMATLRADRNPADVLRGALTAPQVTHYAAILDPPKVGGLLRSINGYEGRPETRIVLQLAAHLFLRPGELRKAEWNEIDFDAAVWRIPAARMKMKQPHAVPLSTQAVKLLRSLRALQNDGNFLFPALHTAKRSICENTHNSALRRLGYGKDEMASHGFRAMASTLLNENGLWHPDAIERSLARSSRP